jgi:hypothetical protein
MTKTKVRNVPTWRMTDVELARVWAAQNGIVGKAGGWLYDAKGKPLVQGYTGLARILTRKGIIQVGVGIHWLRSHRLGDVKLVNNF